MRTLAGVATLLILLSGCSGDEPSPAGEPAPDSAPAAPDEISLKALPVEQPAAPAPPATPPAPPAEDLDVVREYTRMFYEGELDALWENFSPEMRRTMSLVQLTQFRDQVRTHYGVETELLGEESQRNDEYRAFVRWARFDKVEEPMEIQWILRDDDSVAGVFIRPVSAKEAG